MWTHYTFSAVSNGSVFVVAAFAFLSFAFVFGCRLCVTCILCIWKLWFSLLRCHHLGHFTHVVVAFVSFACSSLPHFGPFCTVYHHFALLPCTAAFSTDGCVLCFFSDRFCLYFSMCDIFIIFSLWTCVFCVLYVSDLSICLYVFPSRVYFALLWRWRPFHLLSSLTFILRRGAPAAYHLIVSFTSNSPFIVVLFIVKHSLN